MKCSVNKLFIKNHEFFNKKSQKNLDFFSQNPFLSSFWLSQLPFLREGVNGSQSRSVNAILYNFLSLGFFLSIPNVSWQLTWPERIHNGKTILFPSMWIFVWKISSFPNCWVNSFANSESVSSYLKHMNWPLD